jgi:2-polyprenyl-6-methoxyphenol hydroxylase-like FAD-dependent oxidoreductase
MTSIGIIGSGIAGLQLALQLQLHNFDVTVYTDRSAGQIRTGKLPNTPALFPHSLNRHRALKTHHWEDGTPLKGFDLSITGSPIRFDGWLTQPGIFVDPRIYNSTWLDDIEKRGGCIVVGAVTGGDVLRISEKHDLTVVASGRGSLIEMFARIPEHSPYEQPQRILMNGFFKGIHKPDPTQMYFIISPEHGETFQATVNSFDGLKNNLLMEGIPGQGFEDIARIRYSDEPRKFSEAVLEILRVHAPILYDVIDTSIFEPTSPNEIMQGVVTPAVRKGYTQLENGKFVMAVGDVHITNDPVIGQGANTASHSSWVLGESIIKAQTFDEAFCETAEQQMLDYALPVTRWSNAMLQPPPEHFIALLANAAQSPALATAFGDGFNDPVNTWAVLSDPQRTLNFIQSFTAPVA